MKMLQFRNKKVKFHLTVVTGVLMIVGAMAISTVSMILTVARQTARASAETLFELTSSTVKERSEYMEEDKLERLAEIAAIPRMRHFDNRIGLSWGETRRFAVMEEGKEPAPFPDDLKQVPEYAGTHHEAPDGSGYPRKLSGSELSVPAPLQTRSPAARCH